MFHTVVLLLKACRKSFPRDVLVYLLFKFYHRIPFMSHQVQSIFLWVSFYMFFSFTMFSKWAILFYQEQKGFPEELFAVKMYALTADAPKRALRSKSKTSTNRPKIIMWIFALFSLKHFSFNWEVVHVVCIVGIHLLSQATVTGSYAECNFFVISVIRILWLGEFLSFYHIYPPNIMLLLTN